MRRSRNFGMVVRYIRLFTGFFRASIQPQTRNLHTVFSFDFVRHVDGGGLNEHTW